MISHGSGKSACHIDGGIHARILILGTSVTCKMFVQKSNNMPFQLVVRIEGI